LSILRQLRHGEAVPAEVMLGAANMPLGDVAEGARESPRPLQMQRRKAGPSAPLGMTAYGSGRDDEKRATNAAVNRGDKKKRALLSECALFLIFS
jgi:hypothetical protein